LSAPGRASASSERAIDRPVYEQPYVRTLFDGIAHRYDFLNHLLSFSLDVGWRSRVIELLRERRPQRVLDIATGTGDLAIEAARLQPLEIRGIDISPLMLRLAREKILRRGLGPLIMIEQGSAERLPFGDAAFDAITIGFGIRNFSDLAQGLAEVYRVLRSGGVAVILEFSRPQQSPIRQLYGLYFRRILPLIGGAVSGSREAYQYLPNTVEQFPEGEELLGQLRIAGFALLRSFPLSFGIATVYWAEKPANKR
jgi:demethylmenaquinone methyltransferase/2-methoxy-6-polyprenyl-1,4-benzoquinol methylase